MDTKTNDHVIAGLDVGSSQVTTVLGRKTQDGVEVLGMGECPTEGMRRGAVVNVDATVKSIRQSVTEAERMTGLTVESVFVGISGPLIKSFNSHAAISVKNEHEVTDADFTRVLEIARTVELPNDREILHVLTQEFIVDDMAGIKDPRGMTGIRLDARVHVVTNDVPGARNLARCVEKADLDVESFVLSPLASAEAVLTPEEREVGVVDAPTAWIRYGDLINGAVDQIPRDREVLVICWTSQRGSETVKWLRDHGVPRAFAVKGGLQGVLEDDKHGWIPDGLPWKGATNWSTAFDAIEYGKTYSLAEAKALYDAGAVIIDVREAERFAQMHIDRALHVPIRTAPTSLVSSTVALLGSTSTPIIIYADAYVNTFYAKVLQLRLFRQGYAHTAMLIDPNHEWMKKGYPYEP